MYSKTGSQSYARIDLETQLAGASPHQLITMLLDGAVNTMQCARIYFANGNIARRGEMLSRAINIIDNGLIPALNHKIGKEISAQLEMLYGHVAQTLLDANLHNSAENLPQVIDIMKGIADSWKHIAPNQAEENHGS